jgi:hypothetical protein
MLTTRQFFKPANNVSVYSSLRTATASLRDTGGAPNVMTREKSNMPPSGVTMPLLTCSPR